MPNVEKLSIALPAEMISLLREVVDSGDYASSSEVISEALRDWKQKRRVVEIEEAELRALIREGMTSGPAVPAEPVFERLKAKYAAMK